MAIVQFANRIHLVMLPQIVLPKQKTRRFITCGSCDPHYLETIAHIKHKKIKYHFVDYSLHWYGEHSQLFT